MLIEKTISLPCSPEQCFAAVQTSRLLVHVASPLVRFFPIDPNVFPERWEDKEYLVSMRLFGWLPMGKQVINISRRDRSLEMGRFYMEFRDNGHGALISKWDHLISIEAAPHGCTYTDRVEISAGFLTPSVWLFAWLFYSHRQRRWKKLANARFSYSNP